MHGHSFLFMITNSNSFGFGRYSLFGNSGHEDRRKWAWNEHLG